MSKGKKEILNGLPKGWKRLVVGDVSEKLLTGTTPPSQQVEYYHGDINWFAPSDFKEQIYLETSIRKLSIKAINEGKAKLFPENSLLLVAIGATIGKVGISKNQSSSNQQITSIKFNKNVDVCFAYYWFVHCKQIIIDNASAATLPIINQAGIKQLPFLLPPFPEQQRIVQKLDALFARIDKAITLAEENLEHLRHLLPAALNEVFEEGAANDWKKEKLKNITIKIGSGSTPSGGQKAYKTSGISLIRSMNVYDEGFETAGLALIDDAQAKKLSNVIVEKDDVLLNITGASVARCCVVPDNVLPARVNQHVSIIRFKKNLVNAEYAHYFLTSPEIKSSLLRDSGGGATREAITKAMLEEFEFSFPDLPTQQKIVAYLNGLSARQQSLQVHYSAKLRQLKALKASLLDAAFRGELSKGAEVAEMTLSQVAEEGEGYGK